MSPHDAYAGTAGRRRIVSNPFTISTLEAVGGMHQAPATLRPWKTRCPMYRRLGGRPINIIFKWILRRSVVTGWINDGLVRTNSWFWWTSRGACGFHSMWAKCWLANQLLAVYEALHPSILLALQPWVSLGLLDNQSPLLPILRLLCPLSYLHYPQICYNIVYEALGSVKLVTSTQKWKWCAL